MTPWLSDFAILEHSLSVYIRGNAGRVSGIAPAPSHHGVRMGYVALYRGNAGPGGIVRA